MPARKRSSAPVWIDPYDIPDLSTPEWQAKLAKVPVQRGRPPIDSPKKLVSLRLDQDVIEGFRKTGAGWQTRINETLRRSLRRRG